MKSHDVRLSFLDFFKERNHIIVPSMSLIPRDDPSLLFTSAGMVQFKPLWTGAAALPYVRAASVQKCLRTSDLENVGKTRRHHTFFEMLGNFSFGDYFKEKAILWAWEYFIEVLQIDKKHLYVSVFKDDDEAFTLWHKKIGLKSERIFRLGEEHNFWGPAGNSGPCGPCSEIFYDLGEKFSCGKTTCAPGCDCDRYPEVWNLVFPQFNQTVSGERLPLKNRGVDTGMGLERLVTILEGKSSNFHTDLFYPIVEEITKLMKITYGEQPSTDIATHVIADHIRALVFAISDGIIPSNEERGYVVRRILRRAVRLCRTLALEEAFLYKLVPKVVHMYAPAYPELSQRREEVTLVIKSEEERFLTTLEKGLLQFEDISKKKKVLSGAEAFKLYDTYGFPIELTIEIAREKGITVDEKGFSEMLAKMREVSKARTKFIPKGEWTIVEKGTGTFSGYEKYEVETTVLQYNEHDSALELVLKESPFYAESGGQVGDHGEISGKHFVLTVLDTYWYQGMIVCHCKIKSGAFSPGAVHATVDVEKRRESARAHTATHLLHAALRKILGEHARQEGSFVEPGRFRFDFTHFKPLSDDEIAAIEDIVNARIVENIPVEKFFTSLDEAKTMGAMAIFGEKYGARVRVVKINEFSIELCGGIHLDATGEIGMFKIISQESAAAGIRRVEALVGLRLFKELRNMTATMKDIREIVGVDKNVVKKLSEFQNRLKDLERVTEEQRKRLVRIEADGLLEHLKNEPTKTIVHPFPAYDIDTLRMIADIIRERMKDSIGMLYMEREGKVQYVLFVGPDLVKQYPAHKLIQEISKIIGGGGGGRPHIAEGGGANPHKIQDVAAFLRKRIA